MPPFYFFLLPAERQQAQTAEDLHVMRLRLTLRHCTTVVPVFVITMHGG